MKSQSRSFIASILAKKIAKELRLGLILAATGCHSPLLPDRHSEPHKDYTLTEPYASFDYDNGTNKYYIVHWKGNILNGLSFTAKQLKDVNIPLEG